MRSKEVENSIEILKQTGHEDDFTWFVYALGNVTGDSIDNATETALAYIEQLEQLPNKIRDKIKLYELEIETLKTLYPKSYMRDDDYTLYLIKIKALEELLEGE